VDCSILARPNEKARRVYVVATSFSSPKFLTGLRNGYWYGTWSVVAYSRIASHKKNCFIGVSVYSDQG
jgi:hypothetical protein